jgi:hypothetical protein
MKNVGQSVTAKTIAAMAPRGSAQAPNLTYNTS